MAPELTASGLTPGCCSDDGGGSAWPGRRSGGAEPKPGVVRFFPHRPTAAGQGQLEDLSMNWDRIAGNWKQLKGKARTQWGKLTDDDLEVAAGNRDELIGRIQARYGITKEEAARQVDEWQNAVD
jgi:uncharacterized protein YjbJ (UPF0337 family)